MKERWNQLSAKFDAMTLRERLMVLAGTVVVIIMLFNLGALDPVLVEQKRVTIQLAETRANVRTTENLIRLQDRSDPVVVKRTYRDALRKQIAEIDAGMQGLQKALVPPDQMAKLLEGMLARNRGIALVSLRVLPVQRFESPAGAVVGKAAEAVPDRSIFQHSFELTIEGTYGELHEYLARLEKLPWQMFWGRMNLSAGRGPKLTLTLTVHTLSLNKAWLIV